MNKVIVVPKFYTYVFGTVQLDGVKAIFVLCDKNRITL